MCICRVRGGKREPMRIPTDAQAITLGVDTHKDVHVAVALDGIGRHRGTLSVPANPAGYKRLVDWANEFGSVEHVGVEGTGSFGSGLARFLRARGIKVSEVIRPKRRDQYRAGKSDPIDAEAAARAVLAGSATGQPKDADGRVEMIRNLRLARRSAVKARAAAVNQLKTLLVTAPEGLKGELCGLSTSKLVATASRFRPGMNPSDVEAATKFALRSVARRYQRLSEEISELPERLKNEAAFAQLCGAAPIPASSGKNVRHRLNRHGNRDANRALYVIAVCRMSRDERTRTYVAKRTAEGKTKKEIIRCLKRYIAREIYRILASPSSHSTSISGP